MFRWLIILIVLWGSKALGNHSEYITRVPKVIISLMLRVDLFSCGILIKKTVNKSDSRRVEITADVSTVTLGRLWRIQ